MVDEEDFEVANGLFILAEQDITSDETFDALLDGRVLLRQPSVLLCDEATASVDLETDKIVQSSIRRWLRERNPRCCVLTIAHRLEPIRDYDTVIFLDRGRIAQAAACVSGNHCRREALRPVRDEGRGGP